MKRIPIAVIGAGLIGRSHAQRALEQPGIELVGVADPSEEGRRVAESCNVPWFSDFDQMLSSAKPRGVVVATPNGTHARIAVHCLDRGAAVLVEKPIADTLEDAKRICDASARAALPVMVGHQRRHNPIMRRARQMIGAGRLGRPVCLTAMSTWLKPAEYFENQWRREKGGGPILINLIHDIDQVRFLFGEVESVQAMTSNNVRGFEVEDTAVVFSDSATAHSEPSLFPTRRRRLNWDLAAGKPSAFRARTSTRISSRARTARSRCHDSSSGTTAKGRAGTTS
jgi:predicted dehydrogenase